MTDRLESVRTSLEMLELHEVLAFVNRQAERVKEMEEENKRLKEFHNQWHENMFGKENQ